MEMMKLAGIPGIPPVRFVFQTPLKVLKSSFILSSKLLLFNNLDVGLMN